MAQALATAGLAEQAREIATRAEYIVGALTSPRAQVLASVARALAIVGLSERAREVATRAEATAAAVTSRDLRARMLIYVVQALADAGLHERAEATARTITDPHSEAEALSVVVQALADAGLHERAEATARTIIDPGLQARALARVAQRLTGAQPLRARYLVAQALAVGPWTESLFVNALPPEALVAVASLLVPDPGQECR